MSLELLAIVLASPVMIAILKIIENGRGSSMKNVLANIELRLAKLDESLKKAEARQDTYEIEQAIQDFRNKNWILIDSGTTRPHSHEQWYMLKNNLVRLLPEKEWSDELKNEAIRAEKILRGERNND